MRKKIYITKLFRLNKCCGFSILFDEWMTLSIFSYTRATYLPPAEKGSSKIERKPQLRLGVVSQQKIHSTTTISVVYLVSGFIKGKSYRSWDGCDKNATFTRSKTYWTFSFVSLTVGKKNFSCNKTRSLFILSSLLMLMLVFCFKKVPRTGWSFGHFSGITG